MSVKHEEETIRSDLGDKDPCDSRVSRKGCDQDSCYCSGANGGSSYGAASQLPAAFKLGQSHT